MIRNWAEAIGDANPVYTDAEFAARSVHGGLVAPPAMAQVWTMRRAASEARTTTIRSADDRRARRGRVHLGRRHQLRAGVPPLPAARRAGRGADQPGGRDRPEADRARRGLVRDHAEHLVRGHRGGRVDAVPGAEVPAGPGQLRRRAPCCGRSSRRTRRSSGPAPPPASCGSSAAATAARCATRPARCAPRAARPSPGTWSPPAPARSTATWCTTTRRCPASSCRSWSRWCSCPRASGWSASWSASARSGCGSACRSGSSSSGSTTR